MDDSPKGPKTAGLPIYVCNGSEVVMYRVYKAIVFLVVLMMVNVGVAFGSGWDSGQDRSGRLCFEETVKVANGANPESLSTIYCERASRVKPFGREYRSAMLYNRGIIQRAQGDLGAARASFDKAVRLSRTVDRRNLALAEVAREHGDYRVALEQYGLLTASDFGADSDALRAEVFARQQEADRIYFASVEKSQACASCHGANGVSPDPQYPTLAGRDGDYLEHALRQFKNGERNHALMTAQATQITDDDIPLLANYFASLGAR